MNILSDEQRAAILKSLEKAPDEILLYAASQYKDHFTGVQDDWSNVRGFVGHRPTITDPPVKAPDTKNEEAPAKATTPVVDRKNVSPGKPTTTKIGSAAKDFIMGVLKNRSADFDHFGSKYEAHLKLLWSRNEIKFDGKEFYL